MRQPEIRTRRFWEEFAQSRNAALVAFAWGFAEATLFFIVPDVWIGFVALFDWRAGLRAAAWAVLGALIGGWLMYAVGASLDRDRSAALLDAVPGISLPTIARVEADMRANGPASVLWGPLLGTPYKIYARTAGAQAQPLVAFLLWTVPARGARFVLIAAVATLGSSLVRLVTPRVEWLLGPYVLAWTVFYAVYFTRTGW
jgi:membrane protein YqaA with SNARE-associated domain